MCKSYPKECRANESPVLKRELKVSNLIEGANGRDYDYAVNLEPLTGKSGWLLFNLTTGLWKKSGFHERSLETRDYIEYERDMLVRIPSTLENARSLWYVVVPSTEEQFFDESAPDGVTDMKTLFDAVTHGEKDGNPIPVAIFNSTPRAGEARVELRRLMSERLFQQTRIYPRIKELLKGVK